MDGQDIYKIIKKDSKLRKHFMGVYPFESLPVKKMVEKQCFIFNNNISSVKREGHWLALHKTNEQTIEFYDSFGFPPEFYGLIKKYPVLKNYTMVYHNKDLQPIASETCGLYCIYFISMRARGHKFTNILSGFSQNKEINDNIVKKYCNFY